ncbi:MAG: sensor histidine kinase [Ruminococcus sp.]|nr:sensor histidine kinase [Ruminococcus sp.]
MKLTDFLKDKLIAHIIYIASGLITIIFMSAFHISIQAILTVSIIFLLAVIIVDIWEFIRKKCYYDNLMRCLEDLDKKYLISEILYEPDFYDGKLLYTVLREVNKSMCDNIAVYRHENTEFMEYIELWVHEIKLPVSRLQLMCHNDENSKYCEQLKLIDNYIENVLYYARIRNSEKDYIIKNISLKKTFSNIALKNREELLVRNISVRIEGLDVYVMSDSKWLSYIFNQLMSNSMKYLANSLSPEILVFAEDMNNKTVLHFRDNGIGIPQSDLPYIFEKSFTGENGRIYTKSTGMGLYIVKKLCLKLGHSITAKSVQGEHTDIIISFGKNDIYQF